MKVILNADIKSLGEEGDVKNVANGYYRNFLGPRRLAVPYNEVTVALFEARKAEIEARKEQKRRDSASLKEKLEALALEITVPAGKTGKLFGAVSAQTIVDLLAKHGFEIERKRIEIPGVAIKSVGNYHFTVRLYEAQTAEVKIAVHAQQEESAEKETKGRKPRSEQAQKDVQEAAQEEVVSESETPSE
ncbi:MAG: 50S ribosomal protein L9 [Treponema sp.]|nr:50S ribosomal protein L9 [Treponema sp.]